MAKSNKYVHDSYTERAFKDGYKARSVFKLSEIDRRHKLLSSVRQVLELGAAPGSWSRYILQHLGPNSQLCAVDLEPIAEELLDNPSLSFYRGDFRELMHRELSGTLFDLILSDMAPRTSGNRTVDSGRSEALAEDILAALPEFLRPGGNLLFKLFQGGGEQELQGRLRGMFATCQRLKPQAVRSQSFEIYFLCKNYMKGC